MNTPIDTDFIKWLYQRDYGETISTERLERAFNEYKDVM